MHFSAGEVLKTGIGITKIAERQEGITGMVI